jgi:hypothetical protein
MWKLIAAGEAEIQRRPWVAAAIAALCAIALRVVFAEQRGFWLDEYYTLHSASLPVSDLIQDRLSAGHSPLPFFYAKLFYDALGTAEWQLRLSAGLAVGAAVLCGTGLLLSLGLRRALAPFLCLAVIHPYWQHIGTEFRYTMPLVALATATAWALVLWLRDGRWWQGCAVAILGGLCLAWHGSAQFIVLALLIMGIWHAWPREKGEGFRRLLLKLSPLCLALLSSIPLLLLIATRRAPQHHSTPDTPSFRNAFDNQLATFFGEEAPFSSLFAAGDEVFSALTIIVYLSGLFTCFWRNSSLPSAARRFLLSSLIGIPAFVLLVTAVGKDVQGPERYVAFTSVATAIVLSVAWVVTGEWAGWKKTLWRGVFVLTSAAAFVVQCLNQGDWQRECAVYLVAKRRADEPVITMGRQMNAAALRYHGLRPEGFVDGLPAEPENLPLLDDMIRTTREGAPVTWLFLYRPARGPIGEQLDQLCTDGMVESIRVWEPSREMALVAIAWNAAGAGRLAELEGPGRPFITDAPPRARSRVQPTHCQK